MRGRPRQALRTNVGHARRQGYAVHSYAVDNWVPGIGDLRRTAITPGPVERWLLTSPAEPAATDPLQPPGLSWESHVLPCGIVPPMRAPEPALVAT